MSRSVKHLASCAAVVGSALLAVTACAPATHPGALFSSRDARLTDDVLAGDLARLDSVAGSYGSSVAMSAEGALERARAVALMKLARESYERNDDGTLTGQLAQDAASASARGSQGGSYGAGAVPRTLRADLWALEDSVMHAPLIPDRSDLIVALDVALLRSQYDVLGGPNCREWEKEAERIAAKLRIAPPPPPVVAPPPAPTPPPAPAPAPPRAPPRAPAELRNVPTRVHFALNKHFLAPASQHVLDSLLVAIANFPDVRIVLQGNTDQRGSVVYNEALSRRRANSVRDYLITKGLAPDRITIQALGKSNLETTTEGVVEFARNRRVMMRYYDVGGREIPAVSQLDDLQFERRQTGRPKARKP